jgi:pyridoxal phosphate enzyme (YggS family)
VIAGRSAASRPPLPDPAEVERLRSARETIEARIAAACERVGRDPSDVRLVAVSKTVSADRLVAAAAAGFVDLGENRVQEAAAKVAIVPGVRWHLVGPLQANKARRAVDLFDSIQTIDSLRLARRVDAFAAEIEPGTPFAVLVQVNVDADPAKAGFPPAELEAALGELLALPDLRVEGLMTIGRLAADEADARGTFRALRELGERLRRAGTGIGPELSMGMTDDFEIAVEEGATIVRLGRALFGDRPL